MGTNFYARIIPTKRRKEELIEAINANDFLRFATTTSFS